MNFYSDTLIKSKLTCKVKFIKEFFSILINLLSSRCYKTFFRMEYIGRDLASKLNSKTVPVLPFLIFPFYSSFIFPGAPYQIFFLYLPKLASFHLVVIEQQQPKLSDKSSFLETFFLPAATKSCYRRGSEAEIISIQLRVTNGNVDDSDQRLMFKAQPTDRRL